MNKSARLKFLFISALVFVAVAAMFGTSYAIQKHPIELTTKPICSSCHPDKWPEMDHASDWSTVHKFRARQNPLVCGACHLDSFCADCHASKEEIKPSDKHKDSPEMELPHRGDYVSRHMIDAQIDPAPCFRCHGRGNNARCKACHR